MKKQFIKGLLVILTILTVNKSNAQIHESDGKEVNTITSAVPFLMITPDSRAGGMGDIGVATSPDGNSQHWNAAKYSFMKDDMGVSISYTPWLRALIGDISLSYLSGYKKFKKGKAIAASLRYFSLGNIQFTTESGDPIKDYRPHEFSIDGSYSMLLTDEFSGAISLKFIYSNLTGGISNQGVTASSHPGRAVAGDLSLYYTKDLNINEKASNLSFGMNISNMGNKISYSDDSHADFLPTNLRIGSSFTYNFDEFNSLMFGVDLNKLLIPTPDSTNTFEDISMTTGMWQSFADAPGGFKEEMHEITYSIGTEYWYDKKFALRGGYFHEHATKGNRKFFTMGVGLKLNAFQLDFAYLMTTQQNNPLENTLRFSMQFDFKGLSSKPISIDDK